jgi:hypothetical protein
MGLIKKHFHDQIIAGQMSAQYAQYAPGEQVRFSTMGLATGAEPDAANGAIYGVNMCQVGPALGHGVHLEQEFINNVVELANAAPDGLKCRFGHPGMCMESLGTFVGRFRNARVEGEKAVADLYLDSSAKISPNGNMYDYIIDMSTRNPDMMGPSIVFEAGRYYVYTKDKRKAYIHRHESEYEIWHEYRDENNELIPSDEIDDTSLIYASIVNLSACDIVDEPAATSGMFAQKSFGVQIHSFLNAFPDAWKMLSTNAALRRFFEKELPASKEFFRQYEALQAQKSAGPTGPQGKPGPQGIQHKPSITSQIMYTEKAKAALKKLGKLKFDINATTTDGVDVVITTSSDTPAVGDAVSVVGADGSTSPAPSGTHVINGGDFDGYVLTIDNGVITEITAPETTPVEDSQVLSEAQPSAELAALRAEIVELRAQIKATGTAPVGDDHTHVAEDKFSGNEWNQKGQNMYKRAKRTQQ